FQALAGLDAKMIKARNATSARIETRVSDVGFDHKTGRDVVRIELDARARFRVENLSNGRSRLTIRGSQIPHALTRTLDVGAFGGDVHSISSYAKGPDVVLEVKRNTRATSSVERHGNAL